jgi:hypothetical protein
MQIPTQANSFVQDAKNVSVTEQASLGKAAR